ncbi:hypothetical protein FALCPG4_017528 [Fusarium falciforme]
MPIKEIFTESVLAKYARTITATPRDLMVNRSLLFSCAVYALAGLPTTWDQGSSSVVPSLPGFQKQFNVKSGAKASDIQISSPSSTSAMLLVRPRRFSSTTELAGDGLFACTLRSGSSDR